MKVVLLSVLIIAFLTKASVELGDMAYTNTGFDELAQVCL